MSNVVMNIIIHVNTTRQILLSQNISSWIAGKGNFLGKSSVTFDFWPSSQLHRMYYPGAMNEQNLTKGFP